MKKKLTRNGHGDQWSVVYVGQAVAGVGEGWGGESFVSVCHHHHGQGFWALPVIAYAGQPRDSHEGIPNMPPS